MKFGPPPRVASRAGVCRTPQPRSFLARPGPLRPERHPHPHRAHRPLISGHEFRCYFKSSGAGRYGGPVSAPDKRPQSGTSRRRVRTRPSAPSTDTFASLYFGRAAAENEVAEDPDRFLATYFDRWDLPNQIARHNRFLLLGPKGAGKSAAAWYVALSWAREYGSETVFRRYVDFDELNRTQSPLTSLDKKLVSDQVTSMTDAAWKLFIGVRLLESLVEDPACNLSRDPQALQLLTNLRATGLASDDYPKILRQVRERKGTFGFPKIANGQISSKEGDSLSPGQVGDAVLRLAMEARTPNRHLLAIDGLDKAITEHEAYWQTLAALIRVADWIKRAAGQADHLFVVVMCRNDVFRRVHFADAPKIAADGAIHIEWHAEAADPGDVLLWDYLSRKAQIDKKELLAYLPKSVRVGKQGGVETLRYLLDFTRYTPRDISLLFTYLRDDSPPGVTITGGQVRSSADRFASQHLLSELIAEAVGLLPPEVVQRLAALLSSLPNRIITLQDLTTAITNAGLASAIDPLVLGEYLFLQGAIGNYRPDEGYYQFYHRRDAYAFSRRGPWVMHTGLLYALNVPWSGR